MPLGSEEVERLFDGVPLKDFGPPGLHFALVGDVPPLSGFEQVWTTLTPGCNVHEMASVGEAAMSAVVVVVAGRLSAQEQALLREFTDIIQERETLAPLMLLLPVNSSSDEVPMRTWVEELVPGSSLDAVIWGGPRGYALAFAIQAQVQSVAIRIEDLREEWTSRAWATVHKETILNTLESTLWRYLRAHLFHAIPQTRHDVEVNGRVAGFALGDKVSRGALGYVHAARMEEGAQGGAAWRGRSVGILVVNKREGVTSMNDMSKINKFMMVMQRLNEMRHPCVSRLIEAYSCPDTLYFCMEFAGHQTLMHRLRERDNPSRGAVERPIRTQGIRSLMGQVCSAVCHLHVTADVCHRNIKPENVSVQDRPDGTIDAKVFGFELAVVQTEGQTCKRVCGTVPFVAPEVILIGRDGHDGKAADMWSLGVLLIEVVCGLRCVERRLPPVVAQHNTGARTGTQRLKPPPEETARTIQDTFSEPKFLEGLLGIGRREARPLQTWFRPAFASMLKVDPAERLTAVELQEQVRTTLDKR